MNIHSLMKAAVSDRKFRNFYVYLKTFNRSVTNLFFINNTIIYNKELNFANQKQFLLYYFYVFYKISLHNNLNIPLFFNVRKQKIRYVWITGLSLIINNCSFCSMLSPGMSTLRKLLNHSSRVFLSTSSSLHLKINCFSTFNLIKTILKILNQLTLSYILT